MVTPDDPKFVPMPSDTPILEVENLTKQFGGIMAVDNLNLELERGSLTGLIGPNGAGKTTAFNLMTGFYRPDSGVIRYEGTDLQRIMRPTENERRSRIGLVGLIGSGALLPLAGAFGPSAPAIAGATAVGFGLGSGTYLTQEWVKNEYLDYKHSRPFRIAQAGISRTFQITRELQGMTVRDNLMLGPKHQQGENVLNAWFRSKSVSDQEEELNKRADELLDTLDLDHLSEEYASNLSGGQRRLLELGRVLMTEPDLIMLDEPLAGINPTLKKTLINHIENLRDEGKTFLVVEHDIESIMELSERIIVMNEGQKLMEGPPEKVQGDQRVIDAYLGG